MNYLHEKRKLKLKLFPMKEMNYVKMLVDTSLASNEVRKSVTGFLIFVNNTLVAYKSKKQRIITISSTKAEYIEFSLALKELKFVLLILEEMNMEYIVEVFMDSQSAISIVKNKEVNGQTKHLDIHYKFVGQIIERLKVNLKYVGREDNWSDMLTRASRKGEFQKLSNGILKYEDTE
eukprot:snap_masked-scaffold_34-processed-gene-0.30-mRNA-1 protein AED:0.14 eAED:0.14 QI:0/-1/0/1/-1/1/1/0/176